MKPHHVVNEDQEETFKFKDGETWQKTIVGKLAKDVPFWEKEKKRPNRLQDVQAFPHSRRLFFGLSKCGKSRHEGIHPKR